MIQFRSAAKFDKPFLVVFMEKSQWKKKDWPYIKSAPVHRLLEDLRNSGHFTADAAEIFPLATVRQAIILVGVGEKKDLTPTSLRKIVRGVFLSSYLKSAAAIEVVPFEQKDSVVQGIIDGYLIGTYVWEKYRTVGKAVNGIKNREIHLVCLQKKLYEEQSAICNGVNFARDLINDNADEVTSMRIEKTILDSLKGQQDVKVEILNQKELKQQGLNLHLAVNQGSDKEPKLIIVKYRGAGKKDAYTALIGKGMTFDTGGLNLKPTGSIENMRLDMSGAAAVVGTLKNILALKPKRNIIFVCALAENVIGSRAYKPGDVFKSLNGKTVEIGNTDAEGRLVLADAISYIVKKYQPKQIIDIATLTGACLIALGYDYSGLVSNDDVLARKLLQAANTTDDRAWRLPSYPEISEYIKSEIADIRNTGLPKGAAGALTAAEFLRQFVEDTKWAHLDIAGSSFCDGKGRFYYGHGATGAGVRLLTEFLRNQ